MKDTPANRLGNTLFAIETNLSSLDRRTNDEGREIIIAIQRSLEQAKEIVKEMKQEE